MRETLFKGKRVDNDEWTYGFYFEHSIDGQKKSYIKYQTFDEGFVTNEVVAETVGQYTGLYDKNGNKIFEGDIMRLCSGTYPCLVYWDGMSWAWLMNGKRRAIDLTREKMSIIGNIHDNPEQ